MGKINYRRIYDTNRDQWKALTSEPQKYEALLAGHYSERNHFVYELLQNAEDQGARTVEFVLTQDQLVFRHDGRAFNFADVSAISRVACSTKVNERDEDTRIGKFGIGFKML